MRESRGVSVCGSAACRLLFELEPSSECMEGLKALSGCLPCAYHDVSSIVVFLKLR